MKTSRKELNTAFAEVESLDFKIIMVIVGQTMESKDGYWDDFPSIVLNTEIEEWKDVSLILVGQRSTGTIAVEFSHKKGEGFTCLMSKEERDGHVNVWKGQAMRRLKERT